MVAPATTVEAPREPEARPADEPVEAVAGAPSSEQATETPAVLPTEEPPGDGLPTDDQPAVLEEAAEAPVAEVAAVTVPAEAAPEAQEAPEPVTDSTAEAVSVEETPNSEQPTAESVTSSEETNPEEEEPARS